MRSIRIKKLTILAILTALVHLFQWAVPIRFGPVAITLTLVPIIIGGAILGIYGGLWLGLMFALSVLVQPDTAFFYGINISGTVIVILTKGILCGLGSSALYKLLKKYKKYKLALIASSVVCPVINTGIFILLARVFFFDSISYIISSLVGMNFLFEFVVIIVLIPAMYFIIRYAKKEILK